MKKHVRMLSLAMALVMALSVASTAAVAADAEENVLTAQEDVVGMKKVCVSYYSGYGFWNKVGRSKMVSVPANAHVLTAEDCAETMPEGYEFVLSTLIMVGPVGNQAVVYVKKAPAVKPEPEQPQVPQAVEPESFTVKFINDNDEVVSEQVLAAHTESFYTGIEIPEGNWFCNELRLAVYPGAYISGQTLDEDYTWYEANPTVVFYAN